MTTIECGLRGWNLVLWQFEKKLKLVKSEIIGQICRKTRISRRSYHKIERKSLKNAKLRKVSVSSCRDWGGEKFALTYQLFSSSLYSTHSVRYANHRQSYSKLGSTIMREAPFNSSENLQFANTTRGIRLMDQHRRFSIFLDMTEFTQRRKQPTNTLKSYLE